MKLIIDISEEDRKDIGNIHFVREDLKFKIGKAIMNGTPLDTVRAEIRKAYVDVTTYSFDEQVSFYAQKVNKILDNIGKESEVSE